MSRERPILFSSAMVRAILDGTKTQTRRAMNPQPVKVSGGVPFRPLPPSLVGVADPAGGVLYRSRYGKAGDRLWVRETWAECNYFGKVGAANGCLGAPMHRASWPYSTDDRHDAGMIQAAGIRWRPSIHMPRVVSRITLEVTGVRVERLQDISEADVRAEGIGTECHVRCFQSLWSSINGAASWAANPWVWVIEFKRVTA